MKLYATPTTPFGLMAKIVIHEKGLTERIEILPATTRTQGSAYYHINPSGRVPYLVLDDGTGMEESQLICAYLDHLDGAPMFDRPAGEAGWQAWRLESLARSLLDGLSIWGRELHRAADEQSPTVIAHEKERARRLLDLWDREIDHAYMNGALNMAQITLAVALHADVRNPDFRWRDSHPKLLAWANRLAERPSFARVLPGLATP